MRIVGRNSVVAGVDGSSSGAAALIWATDEATRRKLPLLEVDLETCEQPGAELVRLSSYANVVVLGASHHGPLTETLLGSVATEVADQAECPVVVVGAAPDDGIARHGIVVGVDGSVVSDAALGYAFEQASSRGAGLEIVHAWWSTVPAGLTNEIRLAQMAEERLAVSEAVVGWSEKFSDVPVRQHLPKGPAVLALVEAAMYAELLVVGSRGLGGLRSLLVGSVSHGVLQHAPCPVAVVRQVSTVGTQRAIVSSTSAGATGLAT